MPAKLYARIHPDARNGSTPVRLYDVAGIQFTRGGGSYKGWYPVTDEQAEKLRRCHVANGNPNSMRVFQIEEIDRVDEISASEARSKMAPEQQRIDVARDGEIAKLKSKLAVLDPLLNLLGSPEGLQRLAKLVALDKASSGAALSADEGEIAARVATAPPRRAPMSELDIDDEKRAPVAAAQVQPTPARTDSKAAPAPPARPGARPGAGGGGKKDGKKDEPKHEAAPANVASLPASLPSDISAAMDPSLIDEDDDHDV